MTMFERAAVYFSSGTGNSYRVAVWFRDACRAKNIPAALIPVNAAGPKAQRRLFMANWLLAIGKDEVQPANRPYILPQILAPHDPRRDGLVPRACFPADACRLH